MCLLCMSVLGPSGDPEDNVCKGKFSFCVCTLAKPPNFDPSLDCRVFSAVVSCLGSSANTSPTAPVIFAPAPVNPPAHSEENYNVPCS